MDRAKNSSLIFPGMLPMGFVGIALVTVLMFFSTGQAAGLNGIGATHGRTSLSSRDSTPQREPNRDRIGSRDPVGLAPSGLFGDLQFLIGSPDFIAVLGAISTSPTMFKRTLKMEEPEFTEMWGQSRVADALFEGGEILGQAVYPMSLGLVSYGVGQKLKCHRLAAFGSDLLRAQFWNGFATLAIKTAVNRKRPNGGAYSFPSGHTSSTFATAAVVEEHFGLVAGVPAFIAATYVGLSRLQENMHFLSDVVAGAAIGSLVGFKISMRPEGKRDVRLQPIVGSVTGLAVTLKF